MNQIYLTNQEILSQRNKQKLICAIEYALAMMRTEFSLMTTITYRKYHPAKSNHLNLRQIPTDYLINQNDNTTLRKFIDREFFRNAKNSNIKYFFAIEKTYDNRYHNHMLMSLPDEDLVKDKYTVLLQNSPIATTKYVIKSKSRKMFRFADVKIDEIYETEPLLQYLTKEITRYANTDCVDFMNTDLPKMLQINSPKTQIRIRHCHQ